MAEKQIINAQIISNRPIAQGIYALELAAPMVAAQARPGQFVNVYLNDAAHLLPRPISICRVQGEQLTLVYALVGEGTRILSSYTLGGSLRLSTPLGNGYDLSTLKAGETALLVGGGVGVPPLVELAHTLNAMQVSALAVVGFRDEPFLIDALREAGATVLLATDSGAAGFHGNVVQLLQEEKCTVQHCFACGPKVMLKSLTALMERWGINPQVSLEERMGCGFGACVGCVCSIKQQDGEVVRKKVCSDGPVFLGKQVQWDE